MDTILNLPKTLASDQECLMSFLNSTPKTSEAGSSTHRRHTHKAPSPIKPAETSPVKMYGPHKKPPPTTPPGLSPSKRDGINAGIILWTPTLRKVKKQ